MNFVKRGSGGRILIFLHGWTKDRGSWEGLIRLLGNGDDYYAIDLPGFGREKLPRVFGLDDYAQFVADFVAKKKLSMVVLVGHSFGGRVAIKLAVTKPELIERLILIDSGGIRKETLKVKIAARLPRLGGFGRGLFGSKDYLAATGELRETLKNVVNEDLTPLLSKISVPTLIIWGEKDNTTPLWMGKLMQEKIKGSGLRVIFGGDHGLPYRRAFEVGKIIRDWLEK